MSKAVRARRKELSTINVPFEDLCLGDWYVSRARTITETDLVVFSGLSGDYSSIHIDDEAARAGPFGGRIAHGCLTLSIATGFEFQMMSAQRQNFVIAFYGLDKVRFTKPVRIGDTLHLEAEVIELQDRGEKGGVVALQQRIVNQRDETVVSLEKRTLNAKRNPT